MGWKETECSLKHLKQEAMWSLYTLPVALLPNVSFHLSCSYFLVETWLNIFHSLPPSETKVLSNHQRRATHEQPSISLQLLPTLSCVLLEPQERWRGPSHRQSISGEGWNTEIFPFVYLQINQKLNYCHNIPVMWGLLPNMFTLDCTPTPWEMCLSRHRGAYFQFSSYWNTSHCQHYEDGSIFNLSLITFKIFGT